MAEASLGGSDRLGPRRNLGSPANLALGRTTVAAVLGALALLAWAAPATGTQQYETYEAVIAASEPGAQYRFDDASGSSTLADAVGSDTASNNGITLGGTGPFGGSKSGSFAGEAYASLASNPLEGANAFTAEAWVDWAGSSPYKEPIFDFGSGASDYMYLTPASSGTGHTMLFEIHIGSSSVQLSVPKLTAKAWEYVAVSETGSGTLTLYVNGKEVGQIKSSTLFPSSLGHAPDAYLGKSLVTGEPDFRGSLSNVAFYTKALSEEQIREHYHAAEFPVNTAPPVISGTLKEGSTLTIKENVWIGLEPFTFIYQWQRCNEKGECPSIEGKEATEKEYKTTYHDVGSRLRVQVEAENTAGKGGPVSSAETEPIAAVAPKNTSAPTIEGEAKVGKVLKAQPGTWSGTPPKEFKYIWEVYVSKKWKEAEGSETKEREYRVRSSQLGDTLRVAVTDENPAGSKTADSEPTTAVQAGPPVNTKLPEISGTAEDGHTLSASTGSWAGTEPFSYTYQWELCNAKGEACGEIPAATGSSYGLGPSDIGDTLRVVVTAKNSVASTPATSAASPVIAAEPPSNTEPPKISGTARDGQTLSASTGTWHGSPPLSYAYQWKLCNAKGESCEAILGATSSSYLLGHGDVGDTLRVTVTASNGAGPASATSEATGIVEPLAPSNTELPAISGIARDGQTLSTSTGSWEGTPPLSYTYQWKSCNAKGEGCTNISGATNSTYTLGHSDVATTLRVVVTATNTAKSVPAASEATGVVEALKPANTALPVISGTAEEGQTLSATTGSWEGTPTISYAYQWQDCDSLGESCMNISGATESSYKLDASDVGSTVRMVVTASNTGGFASASSEATAVVVQPESLGLIFLSEFGSEGSGNGQFDRPGGVAIGADDDLWVLDTGNDRVQEFTNEGHYLTQFGSEGSGNGEFDEPLGIAVDASGDLWVLDSGNYRVEEFNQNGEYLSQFPLEIPDEGRLGQTEGIAVDAHGDVWVSDTSQGRLVVFKTDGEYLKTVSVEGTEPGRTGEPEGLAVDVHGDVWVADWNDTIDEYSEEGNLIRQIASEGSSDGQLWAPYAITTDFEGNVWVGEIGNDRVQEFNQSGEYIREFGVQGSEEGDFDFGVPMGLAVDSSGDIWVADTWNQRVERWGPGVPITPLNVTTPSVSGESAVGATLTAIRGGWNGTPPFSYSYQWQRCDKEGKECNNIEGATEVEYQLDEGDLGRTLRVTVTASNEGGSSHATSSPSAIISLPAPPVNIEPPSITGTPEAGNTVTAQPGSWERPYLPYSYQWQTCNETGQGCTNIEGATEPAYHLDDADMGLTLRVVVTAANAGGSASATSSATEAVPLTPPVNVTEPAISGTAKEGETLTANEGEWEGRLPITYNYQWQSCDSLGESCMNIAGATGASYRLQSSDAGETVRVVVSAENAGGASNASSQASAIVEGDPPVNRVAPEVSGSPEDGQTLSASTGEWEGTPPSKYEYQWQGCNATGGECEEITGATASTYRLADDDVGGSVRVVVTATNLAGSGSATSAASTRISPVAPVNSGLPSITGSATQGQTLTANPGVWSGAPAPSYTYQWERCNTSGEACADIAEATSSDYQLGAADVGTTIKVHVVAANAASAASASSHTTAVVTGTGAVTPSNATAPVISGSPQDGQTLNASSGVWEGTSPISYSYQWESCNEDGSDCEPIEGATSSTYTLGDTDEQATLRMRVTASGPGGHAQAVSEATTTIQAGTPSELEAPSISGSSSVDQVVYAEAGTWGGSEVQFSYQWERCNEAGAECQQIPGANEEEYIPQAGDAASTLRVRIGASNAAGSLNALSATSTPVQPAGVLVNTAAPTIFEEPYSHGTLTANAGGWLGSEMISYAYQWQRCDLDGGECHNIEAATGSTYRPREEDTGHTLRVRVNASELEGAASEISATTPPVAEYGAPKIEEIPSISGTGLVGYTLTATAGAWAGEGHAISYSYQWQRCSETGEPCSAIAGATEPSYTLSEADAGYAIRVLVSASDTGGSTEAVSTPIIASAYGVADLAPPQVSGSDELGRPLQASAGIWTGSGAIAISYEWQRCNTTGESCTKIAGATASSYSPLEADARHTLRVTATASGASGSASATSPATPPIGTEATTPENTALPTIEGPLTAGQTLTASTGSWSGSEPISYSYQWQRCNQLGDECVEIEHATGETYTLTTADISSTIRVIVNATNTAASANATSETTEAIGAAGPPANTQAPAIIGQATEGQDLYAENGAWSGSQPLTYYYRWERCNEAGESCTAIEGANKPSYTPTAADVGATVRVNVTAVNSVGSAGSVSAQSETVVSAVRAGASAALETIEKSAPSLVARSTTAEIEEQALAPSLTDSGEQLSAQSTLARSTISKTTPGELSLDTADGELNLTPLQPAANGATMPTIVNGAAALFAETWLESDTIVRPSAFGAITLLQLRSQHAPTSFSWEAGIGPDQQLQQLPNGAVAIIEPPPETVLEGPPSEEGPTSLGPSEAPPYQEGAGTTSHASEEELNRSLAEEGSLTPLPAAPTASTRETAPTESELHPEDTQARYERDTSAMSYAETQTDGSALMVIEPPTVLDAAGRPVAASLTTSGDTITLTLSPTAEATYPISAEIPTAAPPNAVSVARDGPKYGLSDPKTAVFEHLNSGLTRAPLKIQVARDVVPYYAWTIEPYKKDLLTWLKAVGKHRNLKAYITLNAGEPKSVGYRKSVADTTYEADVKQLIEKLMNGNAAEGIPEVKLWGAWNEPDLPPDSVVTTPQQAAMLWKIANKAAKADHCVCKVVAGEFHEYTGLMSPYIDTLRENHTDGSAVPYIWGLHDYYDLEHLQQHTDEHKGNVDLEKFLTHTKGKIWISETGVVLQNGREATPLTKSLRWQVNAANDLLKFGEKHPRVEMIDYYLYEGPTKGYDKSHNQPHAFDSALKHGLEKSGEKTGEQEPREAYCVLILNKKKGCSGIGYTAAVVQGSVKAISAAVTADVDPAGLPTNYVFKYGPSDYGDTAKTTLTWLPSETGEQSVTTTLPNLTACTAYHYEVEVENEANEGTPSLGGERTFTTQCEEEENKPVEERGTYIEQRLSERFPVATTGPFGIRWWELTRQRGITLSDGPEGTERGGDVLNTEEGQYKYRFAGPNEGYPGEGAPPAPTIEIQDRRSPSSNWETTVGPLVPTPGESNLTGSFDLTGAKEVRVVLAQPVFEEEEPVWEYKPGFEFLIEKE